jgi:hypothetical protein
MYIGEQPLLTAEPAYRAIYALAHGQTHDGDYEELVADLKSEGLIGKSWHLAPDQYLDRAAVGYMVCRACRIRGGLNWMLTGLGRYAWRELQFNNIAGRGSEWNLMSGGEFVGILNRAADYLRRTGPAQSQPVELGPPVQ